MKKRWKLKIKYKITLTSVVIIGFLGLSICMLNNLDQDFMKGCMNQGYSEEYCIEHK